MPARLLTDTLNGVDDKDGRVGFGGTADHVSQEFAMARRVDDHVAATGPRKPGARRVDRDRLIAFGLKCIHHEGPLERHAPSPRGTGEFLHLCGRDVPGFVQQTSDQRRLAVVDVAGEHDLEVRFHGLTCIRSHASARTHLPARDP